MRKRAPRGWTDFRYKDLRAWWSNPHYNRPGGVESGTPTAWAPQSKPVWFTGIAASPWMRLALRYGAIVLAVLLFLLSLRRSGERAGRLAERLETTEKANDVQRQMLEAAARRPRDRNELAERLREGRF
ncbi:hypothetical protein GE300_20400 [Rhodobacteraceae bacterium 2CG4]|uniref:GTA TIM-barrel-like domain-containing protein n=1 Tax=Halovulum marinum TaxID=2662447 RepID=A0A6L5Z7J8_9RHOB|nr:hypothetical protein [Halovulum marinum]